MKFNFLLFTILISSFFIFNLVFISNVFGALGAFDSGHNITDDSFRTWSVALGDVDNDGDLDVVTGNGGTSTNQINRVYINQGNGLSWIGYDITTDSFRTLSVALADLNGDGLLDVVTGNRNQRNRVYLNKGNGATWTGYDLTTDSDQTHYVDVGDMDGDGDIDIVVGNYNQIDRVYLNAGNGINWTRYNLSSVAFPTSCIRVRDIDNDGIKDIVLANYGSNSKSKWFRNTGNGINYAEYNVTNNTYNTNYMVVRDLNNDGFMDLIALNENQRSKLLINNGGGTSWTESDFSSDIYRSSSGKATGDLDGDGYLDVIVGNFGSGQKSRFYINNGSGTIWTGYNLSNDVYQTISVDVGDIDGDGDKDVVLGNGFDTNQVNRVYLYTSAPKIVSSLSATPSNVSLGENISVSMYIQNIGDTAANNVVPSALTVSGTGNVNLLSGPIPTSTNIGGHSQSSFTWTYKATSSGTIAFSGNATADGGIHSSVGTSNSINILTPPELQVTLSASPSEVIVGDTINVSMTVHNIGQSKATNVTPSNLSISGGGMASLVSGPLPNSADILGNSNTTFNWTYMATQAGSITFNGNANADGGISSPFSSSNIVNIQTPASLEISILISPSSVDLGDTFNITMNVKNKGDSNANNVRPSALIKTGDGTVSFSTGPNPPSVTINGHSESSFTWTYTATGTGQVAFTGNVSADGGIESPETTSNIIVIKVPPSPPNILSYIVVNPDSLYEGELIEVVMTVDNVGDMEATNVYPSNLIIGGVNGVAILRSGPYPVNVNIGGHSSQTFKWIYYAEEEGRIYFSGHANGDGSLSSPTSTSNILTIKRRPLPPPYPSYNKLLPMRKIMSILNDNKCNDNPSAEGCSI